MLREVMKEPWIIRNGTMSRPSADDQRGVRRYVDGICSAMLAQLSESLVHDRTHLQSRHAPLVMHQENEFISAFKFDVRSLWIFLVEDQVQKLLDKLFGGRLRDVEDTLIPKR